MDVKYQVDGDIFREITGNWLCAFVKESVIVARTSESDPAGNTIEYFKLSDGRVFTKEIQASYAENTEDAKVSSLIRLVANE